MKTLKLQRFLQYLILLLTVSITSSSCDERALCSSQYDDVDAIYYLYELNVGIPTTRLVFRWNFPSYYDDFDGIADCEKTYCTTTEVQYKLYGKSRIGNAEETLLETFIESSERLFSGGYLYENLQTPAFTDFRLILETFFSNCNEGQLFTYEIATFSTLATESLEGVGYDPFSMSVIGARTYSSLAPSLPTNFYIPPLSYEIISVTPEIGTNYISINPTTGILTANSLVLANGLDYYNVSIRVRDGNSNYGDFIDVFSFSAFFDGNQVYYSPNSLEITTTGIFLSPPLMTTNNNDPIANPPLAFEIFRISPEAASYITINATTGVLTSTDLFNLGSGEYIVEVLVTDNLGNIGINEFTFVVTNSNNSIAPLNLVYNPNSITQISQTPVSSVTPTVSGNSPFTFSLINSPVPSSAISINANTGVITATNILALEFGEDTYNLDVEVTNAAGSVIFTNAFTIVVDLP
ncbi:hypothetical protein SAMN05428642_1011107 [Flaviramulus basaltis]|uniref:Cadherin domain-containing protein n=1 Tax=Flaviramulus basaltis TaxID=369401 RepID=A0A1K2IEA4_9FLAO|nr:hypothetical protein [Flaviramulus basaltis]SFZ90729.1 hypothetical protein SAMN05428642_1011107 [Flaviramulus basaltis]